MNSISEAAQGCNLGVHSTNVTRYRDDMILEAPTFSALQQLL